jgi:Dirigent-like protein
MLNRQLSIVALLTGLTFAVGFGTSAQATTPPPTPGTVHHFVLVDHTGPTKYNDIGKKGPSVGDTFTFSETVTRDNTEIGIAGGTCTQIAVSKTSQSQQCVITAAIPEGQFTIQGIATFSASSPDAVDYAITGGTGAYRDARGEVTVTQLDDTSDRIVVNIITG